MSGRDSAAGSGEPREEAQAGDRELRAELELKMAHLRRDQRDEGDSLEMLRAILSQGRLIPKAMLAKPPAAKARSREPTAEEQGLKRELRRRVVHLQQCVQTKKKQWEKWEKWEKQAVNLRDAWEVDIKELERECEETRCVLQNIDRAIDMDVQHSQKTRRLLERFRERTPLWPDSPEPPGRASASGGTGSQRRRRGANGRRRARHPRQALIAPALAAQQVTGASSSTACSPSFPTGAVPSPPVTSEQPTSSRGSWSGWGTSWQGWG